MSSTTACLYSPYSSFLGRLRQRMDKKLMIRKRDWLWLLLLPVYLIISTYRHEAAHAIVATAQGAEVLEFAFWPSIYKTGKFYFGYVSWQGGETNWLVDAAPYFMDILTYGVFFPIVFWVRFPWHSLWLNLVIIGLFSPIVNTFYNYIRGGDVRDLLAALPDLPVHVCFLLGFGLAILGLVLTLTRSAQTKL